MTRAGLALISLALVGCADAAGTPAAPHGNGVVSLDYCADQMVLGLLPRDRILGLSPEAVSDPSFSAPRAKGIAVVRPSLEAVLRLRPRYAVRLYGGAPGIDRQLTALGIKVVQLNFASKLSEVPGEMMRVSSILGTKERGAVLAAQFSRQIRTPTTPAGLRPSLLYMTPGDVTTGPDSFVGNVIDYAGFRSVRAQSGWGSLPLEAMIQDPPDAVLRAFFDGARYRQDRWSAAAHPRLASITQGLPTVTAAGSALACGNWLAGETVAQLIALRAELAAR